MIIKSIILMVFTFFSCVVYSKLTVLAQTGDVKIIEQNCNAKTFECDYVKTYRGKTETLLSQWSKTATAYTFSSTLIGFEYGATGIAHSLEIYDSKNQKKTYFELLYVSPDQKCFVTQEKKSKGQFSIVFYKIPSLDSYLIINRKDPRFKDFSSVSQKYFDEDDGSFNFNYGVIEDGETYFKDVKVLNPCGLNPKVLVDNY